MSRSARQSKILDVLSRRSIHTQEELVDALKGEGYDVTQATVSRDIKELALVKFPTATARTNTPCSAAPRRFPPSSLPCYANP